MRKGKRNGARLHRQRRYRLRWRAVRRFWRERKQYLRRHPGDLDGWNRAWMATWRVVFDEEVDAFGDGKAYAQGLPAIDGTVAGFWDGADANVAGSAPRFYLYPALADTTDPR